MDQENQKPEGYDEKLQEGHERISQFAGDLQHLFRSIDVVDLLFSAGMDLLAQHGGRDTVRSYLKDLLAAIDRGEDHYRKIPLN
jgi:hypothetical protein